MRVRYGSICIFTNSMGGADITASKYQLYAGIYTLSFKYRRGNRLYLLGTARIEIKRKNIQIINNG